MPERSDFKGKLVAVMAKAFWDSQIKQLHQKIAEVNIDIDKFMAFFLSLEKESDRVLAVISFFYIESQMTDLMVKGFNADIPGDSQSLVETGGPLDSASSRMKVCAALYWISKKVYHDLDLLRKIRNEFAHNPDAVDLTHKKINGYISSMEKVEEIMIKAAGLEIKPTLRQSLHVRTTFLCSTMIMDLLSSPIAIRMGLPHDAARASNFDSQPEIFRQLARAAAEVTVTVLGFPKEAEPGS